MAEFQEGVQVMLDEFDASEASSDETGSTSQPRDFHQEQYESYVPPFKRGHNVQQDKFVNIKKNNDEDLHQGAEHAKYQRLKLNVPYPLQGEILKKLRTQFPGIFFHSNDNRNHDHPFSHTVTMIATRLAQRQMRPGTNILDVYGNPNACDRFNTSQVSATQPKTMKALVNRSCPADFIRQVNKWGPFFDAEVGEERYFRGDLQGLINTREIEKFDVLQLVHTLYYIPFQELADALAAPGDRVAYAVVHRHKNSKGVLNNGEQTYEKKWVHGQRLVKQVNVATGSAYIHPDLSDQLFAERKVWMPDGPMQYACTGKGKERGHLKNGLTWECHLVNDETWIIEFVSYTENEDCKATIDYEAMWNEDTEASDVFSDDYMSTPQTSVADERELVDGRVVIPVSDGKFLDLEIPSYELFEQLRSRASGKPRTPKLFDELISTANHLTNPAALFGDKTGIECPKDKIFDVAMAAFAIDVRHETKIGDLMNDLKPTLERHARKLSLPGTYNFRDFCLRDLTLLLSKLLRGARDINAIRKQTDPVDFTLGRLEDYAKNV